MSCQIVFVLADVDRHEFMLHDADLAGCDKRTVACALGKPFVSIDLVESKLGN